MHTSVGMPRHVRLSCH